MVIIKAYDIAIFLIFVLASTNILAASRYLESDEACGTSGHPVCDINIYYGPEFNNIQSGLQGPGVAPQQTEELGYSELAISSFGLLVRSLVAILFIFGYSTFLLPLFLNQLSLPADATAVITLGVWITYVIGYAQYRARSTLQGTE